MVFSLRRALARIFGNFGVSFFGPLLAGNAAESIYNLGMTFEQTIIIALVASTFQTGLAVSKEAQAYGSKR